MTPEEKKDTKAKAQEATGAKQPRPKQGGRKAEPGKAAAKKAEPKKQAARKPAAKKAAAKKAEPEKAETKAKAAAGKAESKGVGAKSKPEAKQAAKSRRPAAKTKGKSPEEPSAPSVRAKASYVRVAPRKARLVADQVRGLPVDEALTLLRFSPRTAARDIAKLIDSATANAENNHDLVADDLTITEIKVDEGPTLRRYRPRALGRATRINKRTSHIQVALTPEEY
jgi:large subunit ribosomal protein L22